VILSVYSSSELHVSLSLHVEWAKAKAWANQWEEVILLDEKMRQVLVFCGWKNT
jgi:hypothetical protein